VEKKGKDGRLCFPEGSSPMLLSLRFRCVFQ
jgi:hypothetical protein